MCLLESQNRPSQYFPFSKFWQGNLSGAGLSSQGKVELAFFSPPLKISPVTPVCLANLSKAPGQEWPWKAFWYFFSSSKDIYFDFSMSHSYTRYKSEEISPLLGALLCGAKKWSTWNWLIQLWSRIVTIWTIYEALSCPIEQFNPNLGFILTYNMIGVREAIL